MWFKYTSLSVKKIEIKKTESFVPAAEHKQTNNSYMIFMLISKKSSNRQHSNPKFYLQNTLPKSQHCCHQQRIHDELQTNTIRRAKFKRGKTIFHSSFVWWLAAADFLFLRFPRRNLSGTFHFRNHPLFLRTEGIGRCQRRRLVWFLAGKAFFILHWMFRTFVHLPHCLFHFMYLLFMIMGSALVFVFWCFPEQSTITEQ